MKRYILLSSAIAALASPAAARDGSAYVGLEAGVLAPKDMDVDQIVFRDLSGGTAFTSALTGDSVAEVDLNTGVDLDLVVGYDLGLVRLEAELGYKRAKAGEFEAPAIFIADLEDDFDDVSDDLDFDGSANVTSLMGNALLDFGPDAGFGAYVGVGLGRARVKLFDDSDSAWALQGIAGVRTAVSHSIDLGLKYRYFRTGRLNYSDEDTDTGGRFSVDVNDRFSSHSLLLSLIYNLGSAAPPPPPSPPPPPPPVQVAPATQTCPDGSVILASEMCPLPPAPPPPPPSAGERG